MVWSFMSTRHQQTLVISWGYFWVSHQLISANEVSFLHPTLHSLSKETVSFMLASVGLCGPLHRHYSQLSQQLTLTCLSPICRGFNIHQHKHKHKPQAEMSQETLTNIRSCSKCLCCSSIELGLSHLEESGSCSPLEIIYSLQESSQTCRTDCGFKTKKKSVCCSTIEAGS